MQSQGLNRNLHVAKLAKLLLMDTYIAVHTCSFLLNYHFSIPISQGSRFTFMILNLQGVIKPL